MLRQSEPLGHCVCRFPVKHRLSFFFLGLLLSIITGSLVPILPRFRGRPLLSRLRREAHGGCFKIHISRVHHMLYILYQKTEGDNAHYMKVKLVSGAKVTCGEMESHGGANKAQVIDHDMVGCEEEMHAPTGYYQGRAIVGIIGIERGLCGPCWTYGMLLAPALVSMLAASRDKIHISKDIAMASDRREV